jgi:voltage-gated potassium channel
MDSFIKHESFRRVLTGSIFFTITIIIAVTGYTLAGWSVLDAMYMVVITIFGVGYGEVNPITSPTLKVFTMLVIIGGTSSAVYIVGGFLQMVTEGEIYRAFHEGRMTKGIETLKNHIIICGYGRIGQILSVEIEASKQPFLIVDNSSDRIAKAQDQGYLTLIGNASDERTLLAAGIERARFLASVLPDDATNVFITLTARGLNPNLIILARGEYPSTENKLKLAGADHVVLPATIGAQRMAHMITHPAAMDFLEQSEGGRTLNELLSSIDVQVDELAVPEDSPLVGGPLSNIEIKGQGVFIVVAVRHASGETITRPSHDLTVQPGDTLIVMGRRGDIPKFAQTFALKRQLRYRGASV